MCFTRRYQNCQGQPKPDTFYVSVFFHRETKIWDTFFQINLEYSSKLLLLNIQGATGCFNSSAWFTVYGRKLHFKAFSLSLIPHFKMSKTMEAFSISKLLLSWSPLICVGQFSAHEEPPKEAEAMYTAYLITCTVCQAKLPHQFSHFCPSDLPLSHLPFIENVGHIQILRVPWKKEHKGKKSHLWWLLAICYH